MPLPPIFLDYLDKKSEIHNMMAENHSFAHDSNICVLKQARD